MSLTQDLDLAHLEVLSGVSNRDGARLNSFTVKLVDSHGSVEHDGSTHMVSSPDGSLVEVYQSQSGI